MRASLLSSVLIASSFGFACGGIAPTAPAVDASSDAAAWPQPDGGPGGSDGSVFPLDAGVTPYDAGTTPYDAGVTPYDAGTTPYDAGVTPYDAGTTPYDAGVTPYDAGVTPVDGGAALGARLVFVHASPNYGSFGLCIGISGILGVADTVKFPNLNAAPGASPLLNLDNGTVSGAIPQATGFTSLIGADQLQTTSLQNAKIEYWGIKNAAAGTSCRSLVGYNPFSPNANAKKLGEVTYASLKGGGGYVAAVTGCVSSGGTKSGSGNLCGSDYSSANGGNLRLSVLQVPSGRVAGSSVGSSFVHLSSSAAGRGLASTSLKVLASGGGTASCPYRVTTVGIASYLTASPLVDAAFGGGTILAASDFTAQTQVGIEVGGTNGNVCGSIGATTGTFVAAQSAGQGADMTHFTGQAGKHMVFLLVGDATVSSPSEGGAWTDPWLRILAFPSSP